MNKQLLILPNHKRFTAEQKAELAEAGFVVVYMKDPNRARLVTPETLPMTGDKFTLLALHSVRTADSYPVYRQFLDGLIAAYKQADRGGK